MAWENKAENYKRLETMLASAQSRRILSAMPDMFATGFSMEAHLIAEDAHGETATFLSALARRHRAFVVGTVVERGTHGGRNTCLVDDCDGKLLFGDAKIDPFSFACEDKHYEKGAELPIVEVEGFQLAPPSATTCASQSCSATAPCGAPHCLSAGQLAKRVFHWRHLLVARAIENLAYVIGMTVPGKAVGCSTRAACWSSRRPAETLAEAGENQALLEADIDPAPWPRTASTSASSTTSARISSARALLVLFCLLLALQAQPLEDYRPVHRPIRLRILTAGSPDGGGTDQDDAFRWLIDHADHGDILVLRASGGDDYNPYIQQLGSVHSVETLVFHDVRRFSTSGSSTKCATPPGFLRRRRSSGTM